MHLWGTPEISSPARRGRLLRFDRGCRCRSDGSLGAPLPVVVGSAANEVILGGSAADRIDAGSGKDFAFGGGGNDTFVFGVVLVLAVALTIDRTKIVIVK